MLQANVLKSLAIWQICLIGAVLMVICGVLKPKEAGKAIPLSMLLLIVGALAMAGALSGTGAGDWIGGGIAKVVEKVNNNYIVGLIFFVIPFVLTQFMSNRGAMLIFIPIAIATCHKVGGDPRGLIILIQAAALTAFMTPMATAAVPSQAPTPRETAGRRKRGSQGHSHSTRGRPGVRRDRDRKR